jgi:hypothetical protein
MLTVEGLWARYKYEDGQLLNRLAPRGKGRIGSVVGSVHSGGYLHTTINGKRFLLHRIIFMMHHGYMPQYVDHIDGNRQNNKIDNLRECTASFNNRNRGKTKRNTTGYKGVNLLNNGNKFYAMLWIDNKNKYLGSHNAPEDAAQAYNLALDEAGITVGHNGKSFEESFGVF